MKKIFYNIAGVLVFLITILGVYLFFQVKGKEEYNTILTIERNQPLMKSLAPLPKSNSLVFKLYLKYRDSGRGIKAGQYQIEGKYSLEELIDLLESGKGRMVRVTIPEGFSIGQIVEHLEGLGHIEKDEFYAELNEAAKTFPYPTPKGNFEGYLYPETYFLPENYDEKILVETMLKEFLKKFPSEKYPDKEEFYQKLIMASILEREALVKSEKPVMASVFYNRLKRGMTLSSDATVNFVYNYSKKRIYYKDLKVDSPYNTYKYKGLPPAPICNPAVDSVEAAYNPAQTDYLFFVAKGDGSHFFSKTYREHLNFQKNNK
jgi:UPF0755 protein